MNYAILKRDVVFGLGGNAMAATAASGGRLAEWAARSAVRRAEQAAAGLALGLSRFVFYRVLSCCSSPWLLASHGMHAFSDGRH